MNKAHIQRMIEQTEQQLEKANGFLADDAARFAEKQALSGRPDRPAALTERLEHNNAADIARLTEKLEQLRADLAAND